MCLSFRPVKLETIVVMRGDQVAGRINLYRAHKGCLVSVPGILHPTTHPGECWFETASSAKAAIAARDCERLT